MAIRAYDELYIESAQNVLGHAVDFAIMSLEIEPDTFGEAFAVSKISKQFSRGNPAYVSGRNGCELARAILDEANIAYPDVDDAMYLDKSPEYWAGWVLAYYQWLSCHSFMDILTVMPISAIIKLYPLYHEMDISKTIDCLSEEMKKAYPYTRLKYLRNNSGMSQSELARYSGVSLRQIQLYEQRQRDINKAEALTIYKLSLALHCDMADLIEH